jgi:hypothetical protein
MSNIVNRLKNRGNYMHHLLYLWKILNVATFIYVFCMILAMNTACFSKQQ